MRYSVTFVGEDSPVTVEVVELPDGRLEARVAGRAVPLDVERIGSLTSVRVGPRVVEAVTDGPAPSFRVSAAGRRWAVRAESDRPILAGPENIRAKVREGAPSAVRSPMPGRVVRVLVAAGERVEAGQGLVVLEAMKMENEVRTATGGTVATVHVAVGATVDSAALLVTLA